MKTKRNILGIKTRRVKARQKKVTLVCSKHPVVKSLRLVEHKFTRKLVHHRHTSYVALAMILVLVGFILFARVKTVDADTATKGVSVGVIVPGPAPSIGAKITSPSDGANLKDQFTIKVSGTCPKETFIVLFDNNLIVGSTACTEAGIFSLDIQLQAGANALSALDYDNLNQPGPGTPVINVNVNTTTAAKKAAEVISTPNLPQNPSLIAGLDSSQKDCNSYQAGNLSTGGDPHIAVVCVPRLYYPKIEQVMGILVWGGNPPYAISANFGEDNEPVVSKGNSLLSIALPGYKTLAYRYDTPNIYQIAFKMTDKDGKTAIVQTATQVNGKVSNIESPLESLKNNVPIASTVPFYLLAIALTLGFWCGDIFDRTFGTGRNRARNRRRTA